MKITVARNEFLDKANSFIMRGKRRVKTPLSNIVTNAVLNVTKEAITFHGCGSSFVLYSFFSIEGVIDEVGSVMIANLDSLVGSVKKFRGNTLTIESDGKSITYSSGRANKGEGVQDITIDLELESWIGSYNLEDNNVYLEVEDQKGKFTKWFEINGSYLRDISDTCLNDIGSDTITMETIGDELHVSFDNEATRDKYNDVFDITEGIDGKFVTEYIFPILMKLSGKTIFYYYVTQSGRLRIIINNGTNWWMCRYDKTVNG